MLVNEFAVKTEKIDREEDISLENLAGNPMPLSALKGDQFARLVFTLSFGLVVAFT